MTTQKQVTSIYLEYLNLFFKFTSKMVMYKYLIKTNLAWLPVQISETFKIILSIVRKEIKHISKMSPIKVHIQLNNHFILISDSPSRLLEQAFILMPTLLLQINHLVLNLEKYITLHNLTSKDILISTLEKPQHKIFLLSLILQFSGHSPLDQCLLLHVTTQ